ncbi:MAG TPA: hypothetical protein VL048_03825 [Xanthobacteraceae bacterium]|nr:hypothetical protein [Xanthobacteraceae bacterium]
MSTKEYKALCEAERKASYRVSWGLDGTETDLVIAEAITDYLLAAAMLRTRCKRMMEFSIISDWKSFPLQFDWRRKGALGIKTKDKERAHDWCMKALLAGFGVFAFRGGMGRIEDYRMRQQEYFASGGDKARQIKDALIADPLLLKQYPGDVGYMPIGEVS